MKNRATLAVFLCAAALAACDQMQAEKAAAPEPAATEAMQVASTEPYVGTWATDEAACAIPQDQENSPHIFGADTYDHYQTHCSYANVASTGENSWHIDAACQANGDEASLGWDLTVNGDALSMDGSRLLVRCRN